MVKQSIFGKHLSDYGLADNGIPYIIIALTLYFDDNDRFLTEGIFRKAAGASDVAKLITNLENGDYESIFKVKDPLIIADVMKKLLKNLLDPLIPPNIYKEMLKFESNLRKYLKIRFKNSYSRKQRERVFQKYHQRISRSEFESFGLSTPVF